MKTWQRVPADTLCGNCGSLIRADFPALHIQLVMVKRIRIRCPLCAGEPAPDLPERVKPANTITPTPRARPSRMHTFEPPADYTNRLLGERE